MNISTFYESPSFNVIEIDHEGLLCGSYENEKVGEEEGLGGFN
jgi:hypothetical protein